jgi:hypothetical protein
MSIELPEASILAKQMSRELRGKQIKFCELRGYQKLQRIGFINKNLSGFDRLSGAESSPSFPEAMLCASNLTMA